PEAFIQIVFNPLNGISQCVFQHVIRWSINILFIDHYRNTFDVQRRHKGTMVKKDVSPYSRGILSMVRVFICRKLFAVELFLYRKTIFFLKEFSKTHNGAVVVFPMRFMHIKT